MPTPEEAYQHFHASVSPGADLDSTQRAFFMAGWSARDYDLGAGEKSHIVEIREDGGWMIQHPLDERADGELFNCAYHALIANTIAADMPEPGTYLASLDQGGRLNWRKQDG